MKSKKHFTLLELVIVIGVMLIGFSLSGFFISKAQRDAKAAKCAENLFRMGKATFKYVADHNGNLPYAGEGYDSWKMQLATYMGIKDPTVKGGKGKFAVYHCPADRNKMPSYMEKDPFYLGKMSYAANHYVIDVKHNDRNKDGYETTRKLNSIDGPDTVILYAENHNRKNVIGSGLSLVWNRNRSEFSYPNAAKKGYHNWQNNYLLLDGGVELYSYHFTTSPEDLWLLKFGRTDL